MSSIKKQKYRLYKLKDKEVKRRRDNGIVRLSVPEPKLSKLEILMACLEESTSSFGMPCDTKEHDAMQTSWFGFDQEAMLRLVKVLIHKEKLKAVKSLSVNDEDQKVESVTVDADGSKTIVYGNGWILKLPNTASQHKSLDEIRQIYS